MRLTIRPLLLDFLKGFPQKKRYIEIYIDNITPLKTNLHLLSRISKKAYNNLSTSKLYIPASKALYFTFNSKTKTKTSNQEVSPLPWEWRVGISITLLRFYSPQQIIRFSSPILVKLEGFSLNLQRYQSTIFFFVSL